MPGVPYEMRKGDPFFIWDPKKIGLPSGGAGCTDGSPRGRQSGTDQASGSRTCRFARLGKMALAARQLRLLETGLLGIARTATHFPDNRRVFFTQGPVPGFAAPDGDKLSLD